MNVIINFTYTSSALWSVRLIFIMISCGHVQRINWIAFYKQTVFSKDSYEMFIFHDKKASNWPKIIPYISSLPVITSQVQHLFKAFKGKIYVKVICLIKKVMFPLTDVYWNFLFPATHLLIIFEAFGFKFQNYDVIFRLFIYILLQAPMNF